MTKKAFSSRPKDKLLLFYIHILCGLFFFLAYSHSELIKQLISVIFFLFCGHANVPYNLPHLSPLKSFPFDNIHRKFSWFLYFFFSGKVDNKTRMYECVLHALCVTVCLFAWLQVKKKPMVNINYIISKMLLVKFVQINLFHTIQNHFRFLIFSLYFFSIFFKRETYLINLYRYLGHWKSTLMNRNLKKKIR